MGEAEAAPGATAKTPPGILIAIVARGPKWPHRPGPSGPAIERGGTENMGERLPDSEGRRSPN